LDTLADRRQRLAAMLRALSHPVRLEIVRTLGDCGDQQCIDLTREVELAQSTVSEHLRVLRGRASSSSAGRARAPATA
jgi:DNA-binding transcriptional ArsR family regulator